MSDEHEPIAGLSEAENKAAQAMHLQWHKYCEATGLPNPPTVVLSLVQIAYHWHTAIEKEMADQAAFEKSGLGVSGNN